MTPSRRLIAVASFLALALGPAAAQDAAKDFPNRAIKIVVPFPAGGPSDVLARLIGQKMSQDWGQPVIIENRPGANTVIGAQIVKQAAPDGYTMLMAIDSTLTMNQFLYRTPPYDPINDFAPVTLVAKTMQLLMVNSASDVKTVNDLIGTARERAGKLNFGAGTITTKLTGFLFNKAANVQTVLVPYNGSAEVTQGLLTKSVDFTFDGPSAAASLIQDGRFRVLAKFDDRPFAPAPNAPTIQTVLPNLDQITVWLGLVAPKGTPPGDRRQVAARGGEGAGRPRHQGEGRRRRALPGDRDAGGICGLHQKGSRPLVEGRRGVRHEVRLSRPEQTNNRARTSLLGSDHCEQKRLKRRIAPISLTRGCKCYASNALLRRNKIPFALHSPELCSSHQDRGFSPAPQRVNDMFLSHVVGVFQQWRRYNQSLRELNRLGDRELADIGITRGDIPRVAWESSEH